MWDSDNYFSGVLHSLSPNVFVKPRQTLRILESGQIMSSQFTLCGQYVSGAFPGLLLRWDDDLNGIFFVGPLIIMVLAAFRKSPSIFPQIHMDSSELQRDDDGSMTYFIKSPSRWIFWHKGYIVMNYDHSPSGIIENIAKFTLFRQIQ